MLEKHLNFLRHMHEKASTASARARTIADRLLGHEPESISKGIDSPRVAPADPPLGLQLEDSARQLDSMLELVHQQLTRLERI
jgi:hypothetical protein